MEEADQCPNCTTDLDGGSIWQTFIDRGESPEKADETAAMFGATRTKGRWSRRISLYSRERDVTYAFACPDCGHEWPR